MKLRLLLLAITFTVALSQLWAIDLPFEAVVVSDGVRMRSTPSVQGSVLAKLDLGTRVEVREQSDSSELLPDLPEKNWWFKVEVVATGKTGWVFGAFLYKTMTAGEYGGPPEDGQILDLARTKPPLSFIVEVLGSVADLGPEMPEYDDHFLPALRETSTGRTWFFDISAEIRERAGRLPENTDGFLSMYAGMGGAETLKSVAVDGATLQLLIEEQTNGGMVYHVELTCAPNRTKHRFEVIDVDVTSEDPGSYNPEEE